MPLLTEEATRDIDIVVDFENTYHGQNTHHPHIILKIFAQEPQPSLCVPFILCTAHLGEAVLCT
jgi:hypothetical protein